MAGSKAGSGEHFDKYAESYSAHFAGFFDTSARLKGEFILEHTKGLTSGLEVGCGLGQVVDFLNRRGKSCVGSDSSGEMVKMAGRRGYLGRFCVMDAKRLKFPANSFDFVYALNVLHHARGWEKAVKEMLRVAGKRVLICEPNYRNPIMWLFVSTIFRKVDSNADFIPPEKFKKPAFTRLGTHYWVILDKKKAGGSAGKQEL